MQKNQNRTRYAGAFWGKITFFWRKDNKVPCIIDVIWEKFNFLGISVVKTQCVIGQKSPNSAQYAVTFWGNTHFFGRKVNKVPCIIVEIWGKLSFWEFFLKKYTGLVGYKVKILLDMMAHYAEKITLFGRKIKKMPCIIGTIWEKINFLGVFCVKNNWLLGKKVKIVLHMQAHFEEGSLFY